VAFVSVASRGSCCRLLGNLGWEVFCDNNLDLHLETGQSAPSPAGSGFFILSALPHCPRSSSQASASRDQKGVPISLHPLGLDLSGRCIAHDVWSQEKRLPRG